MTHSFSFLSLLADASTGSGGPMSLLVPVLLFGGMWMLLMSSQRKRQKNQEKMLQSMEEGTQVVFAGGICGTIAAVKDDKFVIKISENTKVEVLKSAVQSKVDIKKTIATSSSKSGK